MDYLLKKKPGEKIGEMSMELAEDNDIDAFPAIRVSVEVNGRRSEFLAPLHASRSGWIENFGLPPFNEWIGVSEIPDNAEHSFRHPEKDFSERFRSEDRGINGIKLDLKRKRKGRTELYHIREFFLPDHDFSLQLLDVDHDNGRTNITVEKRTAFDSESIKHLRNREMNEEEDQFYRDVFREEALPDVVILKQVEVDGEMPPIHAEQFFPFWGDRFDDSTSRTVELGYLDYGGNSNELDKVNGRWYKLITFEDPELEPLEIQEGNWESTEVEVDGEKRPVPKSYIRELYRKG